MGLTAVPPGEVACIVTSLEMVRRPHLRPLPPSPLALVRWPAPTTEHYRALFRRVGAPWLWYSRLVIGAEQLRAILDDAQVEVYAVVDRQGIEVGLVELDFRTPATCALSYFALVPELTGMGHGGWLMTATLSLAWRNGVTRLWVHTCTLDHPAALSFYRKYGFEPFEQDIETFPDPRLSGILPEDAAPQIPLIRPPAFDSSAQT